MYLIETDRTSVPIEDLKLVVRSGVPVWITWEQKRASTCLRRLEGLGHVTVSAGERSRDEKAPLKRPVAQHVALSRPRRVSLPAPPPSNYTKEEVDAMIQAAAKQAAEAAAAAVAQQFMAARPEPAPSGELEARVEAAVVKALGNVNMARGGASPAAKSTSTIPSDGPLFIPKGIVTDDTHTDLNIEADSAEDAGLADAAAELKKLRRKKKGA